MWRGRAKPLRAGAVALVLALATGVAACGSSNSSSNSSSSGTATPASGGAASSGASTAKGTPIVVFNESAQDTPILNVPDVKYGIEAAIKQINAAGGVKGHPLQLMYCNDKNVPAEQAACARRGTGSKAVAGVAISHTETYLDVMKSAGMSLIGGFGAAKDFQDPTQYGITGGATIAYAGLPFALKKAGATKIAIVSYNLPTSAQLNDMVAASIKSAGLPLVGIVAEPPTGITDFSPYAQKIKSLGADGIIFIENSSLTASNMRAIRQLGLNKVKFSNTSTTIGEAEAKTLGSVADGMLIAGDTPPASSSTQFPGIAKYLQGMDAVGAPAQFRRGTGVTAWLSMLGLAKVMDSISGDVTRQSVSQALSSWPKDKPIDIEGLVKWTPSADGPFDTLKRLTQDTIYVSTVKGGSIALDPAIPPFHLWPAMGLA